MNVTTCSNWSRLATVLVAVLIASPAPGAMLFERDVTADLGPDFFVDDAATGGGDTSGTTIAFNRTFSLNVGPLGSLVSVTGLGFGMPAGGNTDGNSITANVTYLGADNTVGGVDDVDLGTSAAFTHDFSTGAGEYGVIFDAPISGTLDGLGSTFRISVTGSNSIRVKNAFSGPANPSGQPGVRASIAGTSVAVVPEPAAIGLAALAALCCGCVSRRRLGSSSLMKSPLVGMDNTNLRSVDGQDDRPEQN